MAKKIIFTIVLLACSLLPFINGSAAELSSKKQDVFPSDSLYQLESKFIDQDKNKVSLGVFSGYYVVTSLFYASCNYTCPILFESLKKLDSQLKPAERDKVRYLLISFDPQNDTPEVLNKLLLKYGVDPKRWKLLNGSEADVRDLAAVLDVKYRKLPEGGFNHSSVINLLDPVGSVIKREEGLLKVIGDFVSEIHQRVEK